MYHQKTLTGIKGRLQSSEYDDENGKRHFVTDVIAERVTFLSTVHPKEEVVEGIEANDEVKKDSKNKKKAD